MDNVRKVQENFYKRAVLADRKIKLELKKIFVGTILKNKLRVNRYK